METGSKVYGVRSYKPPKHYKDKHEDAREATVKAYLSRHYTQTEVGDYFGVSYATVSRAVKSNEKRS